MAKGKTKFDAKDFLLRKGEVLAVGVAGFCLVVLLLWGVSKWTSAKNPDEIARDLAQKSVNVQTQIETGAPSEADLLAIKPAEFIEKQQINTPAKPSDFPIAVPIFDPTAQPNSKSENPVVFNVEEFQVDLTRSAMPGYDIVFNEDNEPIIAVLTTKKTGELDRDAIKKALDALKASAKRGGAVNKQLTNQPKPPAPGAGGPGPGGGLPGMPGGFLGSGGGAPTSGGMLGSGGGNPYGGLGGDFNANGRRADDGKVIKYIPLKELDDAVGKGNQPALTVVPVRLVTIHAAVPYKKQLDEIKRALRLDTADAAREYGPWYDGFEIQRRETRALANGQTQVIQEWAELLKDVRSTDGNYRFEEKFIEKIDTRAVGYQLEEGFVPYFLKPEMMLSMPLPLLAKDLNVKYPELRLPSILDNIKKLEEANKPKVSASELQQKVAGSKPRNELYKPRTNTASGFGLGEDFTSGPRMPGPGPGGAPTSSNPGAGRGPLPGGPGPAAGGPGAPRPPEGYGSAAANPDQVENYLLRFVDCDVKPGHTYEYRIRLRMHNPNYGRDKFVANPEFAKETYRTLYSKWRQLTTPITVPAESFLFAFDTKSYRENTEAAFASQKELLRRFQLQDYQAAVQVATWMEQVKTESGAKREPVGAWVVAEMPVGRGEYIGRRQYVKLPLWSSTDQGYVLREVADKVVRPTGAKETPQPKGWLVDFATKSILVDFEGGRVKTRSNVRFDDKGNVIPGTRSVDEEAATELLIARPDGKLVVRSSRVDDGDENRKDVTSKWAEWLKLVEARKSADGATSGAPGEFAPKKP